MRYATETYVYDGDALVVGLDASGNILRRYVPGQGADETLVWYEGASLSNAYALHTDEQGSIIAASDNSGNATATYAYSATGEPSGGFASGGPIFRYTGQAQLAAAGLYYYKARVYDPVLGRFLQTDPEGYAQGLNLYAYVMNNYPNATDPSGMGTCIISQGEGVYIEISCPDEVVPAPAPKLPSQPPDTSTGFTPTLPSMMGSNGTSGTLQNSGSGNGTNQNSGGDYAYCSTTTGLKNALPVGLDIAGIALPEERIGAKIFTAFGGAVVSGYSAISSKDHSVTGFTLGAVGLNLEGANGLLGQTNLTTLARFGKFAASATGFAALGFDLKDAAGEFQECLKKRQ